MSIHLSLSILCIYWSSCLCLSLSIYISCYFFLKFSYFFPLCFIHPFFFLFYILPPVLLTSCLYVFLFLPSSFYLVLFLLHSFFILCIFFFPPCFILPFPPNSFLLSTFVISYFFLSLFLPSMHTNTAKQQCPSPACRA